MKGNELVWRTLLDGAIAGKKHWQNLADVAFYSSVPLSTTHLATKKLSDIGALNTLRGGGLSIVNPDKIATVLCAWRNLGRDTITWTTNAALDSAIEGGLHHAWGGPRAAIHWLGGQNKVADFSQSIAYVDPQDVKSLSWPAGDEVRLLEFDSRGRLDWDGFSSIAQTYADLFASPGWQSSEFRLALKNRFLPDRNWEQ
jgi:hypothetical protein